MSRSMARLFASCKTIKTLNSLTILRRNQCTWYSPKISENLVGAHSLFNVLSRSIHTAQPLSKKASVGIVLVMSDGKHIELRGKEGDSILDVIVDNNVDIKGFGACEGTVSCSTCHVMFKSENFKQLDAMSVEEEDVLDMAQDVTPLSRLGCQVVLTKELEGLKVFIPEKVQDIRHSTEDIAAMEK